jgi:hypothetical protein
MTVTVVLIVLLGLGGLLSLTFGLFFLMAGANCADSACTDRVGLAVLLIELAPVVAWAPTTAWAVVRMARRKVAFWVPLLALPIYVAVVAGGVAVLGTVM